MLIFIFILGTIFGSFFNLFVDRRLRGESIIFPGSHCDYCSHSLRALDLVPLISFIFLKGRCRYCGAKLSLLFPGMEILGGLLLVFAYLISPSLSQFLLLALGLYLALLIAILDLRSMEYFSYQVYLLLGLGFFYRLWFVGFDKAFGKFFLIFTLIYLLLFVGFRGSIGSGDYYYYMALALFLKSSLILPYILISIWLGGICGLGLAIKKKTTKAKMAFCPFIFLAFVLVLILKEVGVLL